jgi:oxygen-independent coproporphyrinogen III oxidase
MMKMPGIDPSLIRKYDQPVPRYTSYPTVPFWNNDIDPGTWKKKVALQFDRYNNTGGISLYIHLPFCESLCTYCGCNKKITRNHQVEDEYILAIEKEWGLYRQLMHSVPVIKELHLGGGTPTFFSPSNLQRLLHSLLKGCTVHPEYAFSIEGHPNNTTPEHLHVLHALGFRRISYGVQDMDPQVQRIINRIQPIEHVQQATDNARSAGFTSVNFDLIYGLPLQTMASMEQTIHQVIALQPDRIAFYSYAHVPWTSKGQRLFNEADLPGAAEKIQLYLRGKDLLMNNGYFDIGMDHFARPHDELYEAKHNGSLNRNFMGYTAQNSSLLIGLGVSSISDAGIAFAQNEKTLHDYYVAIHASNLAVARGYFLNEEDMAFRQYIKDIACKGTAQFNAKHLPVLETYCFPQLDELVKDGLVVYNRQQLQLLPQGQYFIRNICRAFDLYLLRNNTEASVPGFSKAI